MLDERHACETRPPHGTSVPSRRQQRAERRGHGARTDARGCVDEALAREPGLEFRRRAATEKIAHGERVVERWV